MIKVTLPIETPVIHVPLSGRVGRTLPHKSYSSLSWEDQTANGRLHGQSPRSGFAVIGPFEPMPSGTGITPPRCHPPPDGGTLRHVNNSLPGPLSEGSVHGNGSRQPDNWLLALAEPFVTVLAHGNGVMEYDMSRAIGTKNEGRSNKPFLRTDLHYLTYLTYLIMETVCSFYRVPAVACWNRDSISEGRGNFRRKLRIEHWKMPRRLRSLKWGHWAFPWYWCRNVTTQLNPIPIIDIPLISITIIIINPIARAKSAPWFLRLPFLNSWANGFENLLTSLRIMPNACHEAKFEENRSSRSGAMNLQRGGSHSRLIFFNWNCEVYLLHLASTMHHTYVINTLSFRRRLSAEGAKPESNNRWKSELGHVCGWVCMVFGIISRTKARSATNEIPKCRSPERTLLRHHIIGMRLLTSARRAKLPK